MVASAPSRDVARARAGRGSLLYLGTVAGAALGSWFVVGSLYALAVAALAASALALAGDFALTVARAATARRRSRAADRTVDDATADREETAAPPSRTAVAEAEAADASGTEPTSAYGEPVLGSARHAAERVRAAAREDAERIAADAAADAAAARKAGAREAKRVRAAAARYNARLREQADAYATEIRLEADEFVSRTTRRAEEEAREIREAAARDAKRLVQAARRKARPGARDRRSLDRLAELHAVIGDLSAELGKHARRGGRARGTRPTA